MHLHETKKNQPKKLINFDTLMLCFKKYRKGYRDDEHTCNDIDDACGVEECRFVNTGTRFVGVPLLVDGSALEDGDKEGGCVISNHDKCGKVVQSARTSNQNRISLLEQSSIDEEERELRETQCRFGEHLCKPKIL